MGYKFVWVIQVCERCIYSAQRPAWFCSFDSQQEKEGILSTASIWNSRTRPTSYPVSAGGFFLQGWSCWIVKQIAHPRLVPLKSTISCVIVSWCLNEHMGNFASALKVAAFGFRTLPCIEIDRRNADGFESLTLVIFVVYTLRVKSLIIPFSFRISTLIVSQTDSKGNGEWE
jgi:hypothetical protein